MTKNRRRRAQRALQQARNRISRCVLCQSSDVKMIGIFIPHHPGNYIGPAIPPTTLRIWQYGVCAGCSVLGLEAVGERVEQLLSAPLN